jgi:hypothetical protein
MTSRVDGCIIAGSYPGYFQSTISIAIKWRTQLDLIVELSPALKGVRGSIIAVIL